MNAGPLSIGSLQLLKQKNQCAKQYLTSKGLLKGTFLSRPVRPYKISAKPRFTPEERKSQRSQTLHCNNKVAALLD